MQTELDYLKPVLEPSPEEINEAVQNLKEWISKEPHLPQIEGGEWLKTFFYHNKFSLEKTKSKLDGYYSIRNKYPRILKNRDPNAPEMALFRDHLHISPKLTADGGRVAVIRHYPDPDKFVMEDHLKYITMCLDLLLLEKDMANNYVSLIIDLQDYQYRHFLKVAVDLKSGMDILVKAYTERIDALHLVNTPSFIDLALKTFLPLLPEKYAKRMQIHDPIENNLAELIGKDVLHSDLGGEGPSYAECGEWTFKKLEQHKKWFEKQDDVCSDERLRKKDGHQFEEMKGSFRKLEVD